MPPNPKIPKSHYLARVKEGGAPGQPRWAFTIIGDNGVIRVVTATSKATVQANGLDIKNGDECMVRVDNFNEKDAVKDVMIKPWGSRNPEPVKVTEAAGNTKAAGEEGT